MKFNRKKIVTAVFLALFIGVISLGFALRVPVLKWNEQIPTSPNVLSLKFTYGEMFMMTVGGRVEELQMAIQKRLGLRFSQPDLGLDFVALIHMFDFNDYWDFKKMLLHLEMICTDSPSKDRFEKMFVTKNGAEVTGTRARDFLPEGYSEISYKKDKLKYLRKTYLLGLNVAYDREDNLKGCRATLNYIPFPPSRTWGVSGSFATGVYKRSPQVSRVIQEESEGFKK